MTHVLVVDDSSVDRALAGGLLEKNSDYKISYAIHGADALTRLAAGGIDVVVTDLQMPQVNGLELVQAVRERYPAVPVVLMTAQGSEDVAIQALVFGAASYVPKARLNADLADTVDHVLSVARSERNQERLMDLLVRNEVAFELNNDATVIPSLVEHLQRHVTRILPIDETGRMRIGIALEEALLNALYHGNLEIGSELREGDSGAYYKLARERSGQPLYAARKIFVDAKVSRSAAQYVVRDEGPGYDASTLPDPTDPANLEKISGRGLLLIRTFMDDVRINPTGNEITMVKTVRGK